MVMPRYFFHLSFGRRVVPDEEGVELQSRTAARDEALAVVRDLANPEIGGNSRRWASWFLDVADKDGGFFRTPVGHPALEVVESGGPAPRAATPELKRPRLEAMAAFPQGAARARTAEIVGEMTARQKRTAQLLKDNEELRRELSSICLASEVVRVHARRLVSLARTASDH
jgi:hypothetical protein